MAVITQELVERLIKEMQPPKPKTSKEMTGWKQTKNGRVYIVQLHDEATGIEIEAMAQAENLTRQRIIAEAIVLRKRCANALRKRETIKIDSIVELERALVRR